MCTEGSQWGHRAKECRVGGRIPEIGQDAEENEEGHGDDHRHVAILERDGSICATDKNWGKGEDGCLANADEWTQVKRRGVSGSPRSKHLSADMPPSRGWACAPQRKTSQVSQRDRNTRLPPGLTVGDAIEAAEKKKFSTLGDVVRIGDSGGDPGDAHHENYEIVRVTADSEAVDHVNPRSTGEKFGTRDTEDSKRGMHCIAANGTKTMNQGEKTISGITEGNVPQNMTWQVAEVKKPLASIGRTCDAGNTAVFTKEGGCIVGRRMAETFIGQSQKSRQPKMQTKRESGVYQSKLYVEKGKRDSERSQFDRDVNVILESYSRHLKEYDNDFPRLGD